MSGLLKRVSKKYLIEPMRFYYNIIMSLNSLNIIGVDDNDCILVNEFIANLYCVEIAGAGESINFLPNSLIDSLTADFCDVQGGEFVWVLLKDGLLKRNLIFTQNKDIAIQIQKATRSDLLNFVEHFDILISLYFNNNYEIDWYKRELKQKIHYCDDNEYENPLNIMNEMIRERAFENYQTVKYYQGVNYKYDRDSREDLFDIETFYKINFKGALYTKITFNKSDISSNLENLKFNTMGQFTNRDKKVIKELKKETEAVGLVMINTVLQVFEDYGNNISTKVGKCGFCTLDMSKRNLKNFTNKTPIFGTNKNFSKIISKNFLYNYIAYNTKLNSDMPHLCGTNRDDTFVNFGFKKATKIHSIPKAHTILLGTSGSGKTITANIILKQLLGYDYNEKKMHHAGNTAHVIFDIKDSFYNVVKKISEDFPEMVDMNDFNKNDFLYNIVECDTEIVNDKIVVSESDLDFSSTLISLILASNGDKSEALNSSETEEYKDVLREIYNTDSYDRLPILRIRETHPKEYDLLRTKYKYAEFTPFDTIKEKGFEKFNMPLLHNVINKLEHRESDNNARRLMKNVDIIQVLLQKLRTIDNQKIFSSFSKLDFKKKDIIYFRTDNIVGNNDYGYLIFAMQSILAKNYKKSQHNLRIAKKKRPLVFFWFEEARNIFANDLFKERAVFERIINEWRSYDLVFFPVTQEPEHIPDNILNGFEIKMILTSGDDPEEKDNLIKNLSRRLAIGDSRKKILETLPKYTMMVTYGDGAFTMKFEDDEAFRNIIDT